MLMTSPFWIAATAALATVGSALVMTTDYETYRSVISRMIENLLNEMVRARLLNTPLTRDYRPSWKFYQF